MFRFTLRNAAMALFGLLAAIASASTIDTADRGYYYGSDFSDNTNKNYIVGQINIPPVSLFHDFFAFDPLSGLGGTITGATLTLFNPAGGYSSTQTSETLTLDGFTGDVPTLEAGGTVAGEYAALAGGTVFGSVTVDATSDNTFVSIPLNAAAIAFLNANSSSAFAFGGFLSSIPGGSTDTRFEFGGSAFTIANDGNTYLTVTTGGSGVPEPGTVALMLMGLAGVVWWGRRFRLPGSPA